MERQRKVHPVVLFWVLVLSFGVGLKRQLAALRREYERQSGTTVAYSSFYERFAPELTAFLHACVERALHELCAEGGRKLSAKLQGFKDLLIQDTTVVRLHRALADAFPSTAKKAVAAGVKVGVLVSCVADGPRTVKLFAERTHDLHTIRVGKWVKDRILLLDLEVEVSYRKRAYRGKRSGAQAASASWPSAIRRGGTTPT